MKSSTTFFANISFSSLGLCYRPGVQAIKFMGGTPCNHMEKGKQEKVDQDINDLPSPPKCVGTSSSSSIIYMGMELDVDSQVISADEMPVSLQIVVCGIKKIKSCLEQDEVGQNDIFSDREDCESKENEKSNAFLVIRSEEGTAPQATKMRMETKEVLGHQAQPPLGPIVLVYSISGSSGSFVSTNEDNIVAVWVPVNPEDLVLSLEFESRDDFAKFLSIAHLAAADCLMNDLDLASSSKVVRKYSPITSSLGHKRKHESCSTQEYAERDATVTTCYGSSHRSDGLIIVAKKDTKRSDTLGYEIVRSRSSTIPCSNFPYFVTLSEWPNVSDYHFLLMCQIKRTHYGSDSRAPNRKTSEAVVEGYAGFKCRHCNGTKKGVYYPSSGRTLQANSGLFKHLMKCPCCPDDVKRALQLSKTFHKEQLKGRKSGYQGFFFEVIWQRLHDRNFIPPDEREIEEIELIIFRIIQKYRNYRLPMDCASSTSTLMSTKPAYMLHVAQEQEGAFANLIRSHDTLLHGGNSSTDECEIMMNSFREGSGSRSVAGVCQDPVQLKKSKTCLSEAASKIRLISSSQSMSLHNTTSSSSLLSEFDSSSQRDLQVAATGDHRCDRGEMSNKTPLLISTPSSAQSKPSMGFNFFFSHEDDENLIKGLLKYGTKWSLIYSECELGHIPRSLIRDRASTVQFRELLERAQNTQSNFRTPDAPNRAYKWRQSEKKKQGDCNVFESKFSIFESAIPLLACTTPSDDFCLVSPLPSGESGFKSLLLMDDEDMVNLNEVLCGKGGLQRFDNKDKDEGKSVVNLADI